VRCLRRARVWVRLIAAVVIALMVAGAMLGRLAERRTIFPMTRTWYMSPWLLEQRREVMRFNSISAEMFIVEPYTRYAITGAYRTTDEPIPDWARDHIELGRGFHHRGSVGWPVRFAAYEAYEVSGQERLVGIERLGPIPVAVRPRFPGILLLVAALYGLLLAGERALWIPHRLRGRRRRRRGWCERCGYDLSGLDGATCPECAASFTRANSSSENAR
jgi:hypothetical protein